MTTFVIILLIVYALFSCSNERLRCTVFGFDSYGPPYPIIACYTITVSHKVKWSFVVQIKLTLKRFLKEDKLILTELSAKCSAVSSPQRRVCGCYGKCPQQRCH